MSVAAFEACATAVFILTGFAVGLRLLLLARRTREIPELALGGGLFLIVGIGYPIYLVAATAPGLSLEGARRLAILSTVCLNPGMLAVFVFTWRVFRPEARWAALLAACVGVALALLTVVRVQELASLQDRTTLLQPTDVLLTIYTLAGMSYLWSSVEAFLCHGRLRRQLALGLIEPVVANRVLLWATGSMFALLSDAPVLVAGLLRVPFEDLVTVRLMSSLAGLGCGAALYLAFFPPRFYLRRLAGREATA
jgi:hypothetical protein